MSAGLGKSSSPNSISDYASKPAESFPSPGEPPKFSPYLAPDPRTSSSQSLISNVSDSDPRRTLILIYVHGFYGNDQSFQSFPYHVHSFLRTALAETHVIHSKIYPRYKTYRAIEIARDNFSQWLEPHESPTTDVILVGHSMGGILAADVVLMVSSDLNNLLVSRKMYISMLTSCASPTGTHTATTHSNIEY